MAVAIDEMTGEQTLDGIGSWHRGRVVLETRIFVAAAHFADVHNADSLGDGPRLPGQERAVHLGGAGTPAIAEFKIAEFGARLQMHTVAARNYFADALDCRHRLPLIWARVVAGEVRVDAAREVAKATRELSADAAARVDAELCRVADGRLTESRFQSLLAGAVTAADPDLAAHREAVEAAREYARPSRSSEHGMKGFYLRSDVGSIASFEATVAHLAAALKALGDDEPLDKRRAKACLIMANPLQAVQLMAAFAAHRAQPGGAGTPPEDAQPAPAPGPDPEAGPGPEPESGPGPESKSESEPAAEGEPARPTDRCCPTCGRSDGDPVMTGDPTAFIRPRPFRPGTLGTELARLSSQLNDGGPVPPKGRRPFVFDWARLMPKAVLYVHTSRAGLDARHGSVVRVEGEGPVSTEWLRDRLGPRVRFAVKEVIDLARQTPVDAYEVPARHREAVALRTPVDCFPFAVTPARDSQIDHTKEYEFTDDGGPPGQSRLGNYGPLNGFHHRIKTSRRWTVRQPFDGIYLWRDPYGQIFLVDGSGTRQVTHPDTGRHEATADVALELYDSEILLDDTA